MSSDDQLIDVVAPLWRPFQLRLNPKSSVQADMLADFTSGRTYEPGTWQTFTDLLRPGDTVIDVGAHVGVFTCLAAALVGVSGAVIAFEPNNENRTRLKSNVTINGFQNVQVDESVVGDSETEVMFFRCADNDGGHALWNPAKSTANLKTREHPKQAIKRSTTIDHAVVRLAHSSRDYAPVRLIKIDTEGAELTVLKGAANTLTTHRPAIIAEINAFGLAQLGGSEESLREHIRGFGYTEFAIQDSAPWHVPVKPEDTMQQAETRDGRTYLPVFNMLFLPERS
jgi:FkbM family methyltransferase